MPSESWRIDDPDPDANRRARQYINKAEEILLRARGIARQITERVRQALETALREQQRKPRRNRRQQLPPDDKPTL